MIKEILSIINKALDIISNTGRWLGAPIHLIGLSSIEKQNLGIFNRMGARTHLMQPSGILDGLTTKGLLWSFGPDQYGQRGYVVHILVWWYIQRNKNKFWTDRVPLSRFSGPLG